MIIKYLKKYWHIAIFAPVFMIIEVGMDLLQPKLMSAIVDDGILNSNMELIIKTGLIMLSLVLVGCLGGILSAYFGITASQKFGNDLRKDTFKKVMSLSLQQTDKFTTGSLVTRLTNDITACQDFVAMSLRMVVRSGMQFVGGIIMVLVTNVNFGIVLIISLPLQLLAVFLILKKASPLFTIVQTKLDKVNSVVQEDVSGARVVKAYTNEEYEIKRFEKANNELVENNLRVQKLIAFLSPVLMIVMNLSVIAIIYIGGCQVEARQMNVGEVMASITYVTQILMSVMMIGNMFQQISRAKASAARIKEVLSEEAVIFDGETEISSDKKGTVSFRNVTFSYPGQSGKPVLHDINLDVKKGETVAVLGATGSGKSTLVNLLPRFYDAVSGEVLVDGVPVRDYKLEDLRGKIGFVLQKSELFSGTVAENIRWGNENATDEEIKAAATIAQADEFIKNFKDGYDTIITEKGASLSGGQKQRLSIARAILRKPEILIFDDSTSALDLATEARLHSALRENLGDTTFILIAQRIASVMNADKIAIIENGTIADIGTHSELLQRCAVYQEIYKSQNKSKEVV